MAPAKPREPNDEAEDERRRQAGPPDEQAERLKKQKAERSKDDLGPKAAHAVDAARRAHLHGFLEPEEERVDEKP
jgi:hypothetical protein